MDYRVFILFSLVAGVVSQSSWKSSSNKDAGPCETAFNTTVLNSIDDVSIETVILESIDVLSYSRGQLNDWTFRVCRNFDNIVSRLNQSCSDRNVNHSDVEEHASYQKSLGLVAKLEYLCSNSGSNLKDFVLGNGPQCIQEIARFWKECPETSTRATKPTQAILTTYKFSSDVCSFLVSTETCYVNAFSKSNICIGNSKQHFQTVIGILLEKAGCADKNVFGKPLPIGFSDVPSFNFKGNYPTLNPGQSDHKDQFNQGRFPGSGREPSQVPQGSNQFAGGFNQNSQQPTQFPSSSNQFQSGTNQFPSGPNGFPSRPDQFSFGADQFTSNSNQGDRGNQFGMQRDRPVTPRIYNSSRNSNQYFDYNAVRSGQTGFNPNQPNVPSSANQNPYNTNYPNVNNYDPNVPNTNHNYWNDQNNQFPYGSQNTNQNQYEQYDPSHPGPKTLPPRPGYATDRFDRYNRTQPGVYISQGERKSGAENKSLAISSFFLTLFCSFLLR